jgi:CRISPR-associated endonuclease Cas1
MRMTDDVPLQDSISRSQSAYVFWFMLWHATHPINAMLNYGYGILENRIRAQIVGTGFDPTIGYFHGNYRDKHALVYDLMEPFRPLVDRFVLEFADRHAFDPADFIITRAGACRLNPQLARTVVQEVYRGIIATAPSIDPAWDFRAKLTDIRSRPMPR